MSNTLRRKMFKLGGEVSKSHGVGLTSRLKYNKGGNVQASYGVGNNANKKVGPDGQVREAHNLFLQAGKGLYGLGKNLNPFKGGGEGALGTTYKAAKNLFSGGKGIMGNIKGSGNMFGKYIKGTGSGRAGKTITETGTGAAGRYVTRRTGERAFTSADRARQALRAAQLGAMPTGAGLMGAGMGQAALQRAGLINPIEENDNPATKTLKTLIGGSADFNLFNAANIYGQKAFGVEDPKGLYEMIAGGKRTAEAPTPEKVIKDEETVYKDMKSDAEKRAEMMYKAMGGGANFDMGVVSNAFLQAAPFVAEGEYAKALTAAGTSVNAELEADKQLKQQITGTVIEQEIAQDMADENAIRKLVADGSVDSAMEARRLLNALDQNEDVAKPKYDNKDNLDVELMEVGKVYTDVKNASGDLYVVKNSSGQVQSFNRYEEAAAYAET
tara:strand:+ start:2913 stop:4235 length:1323 start_codon:yes stop_codon:yes gene_type:complete